MQQIIKNSSIFGKRMVAFLCVCVGVFLNSIHLARSDQGRDVLTGIHSDVKIGNGYIEIPVYAHIKDAYSKGDNLSFTVFDSHNTHSLSAYVIDWRGNILWSSKEYGSKAGDTYLKKNGWIKLEQGIVDTFHFPNNQTLQLLGRVSYTDILDTCLYAFNMYLIEDDELGHEKKGTFIRLLKNAEEQYTPSYCFTEGSNPTLGSVKTRLAQPAFFSQARFYKLGPNKVLLTNDSVAVLIKPNLDFYADHPADYYYIPVDEVYAAERKAILSVFNGDAEAFKKESKYITDYSAFKDRPDQLPEAEEILVNELDHILKRRKDDN